jgi:hypothetical protein
VQCSFDLPPVSDWRRRQQAFFAADLGNPTCATLDWLTVPTGMPAAGAQNQEPTAFLPP